MVLQTGIDRPQDAMEAELVALVRHRIGSVAAFRDAIVVPRLPKKRSGKILRATMCKLANGEVPVISNTIEDVMVIDQIREAFAGQGQKSMSNYCGSKEEYGEKFRE